jgi:hypothetical protein
MDACQCFFLGGQFLAFSRPWKNDFKTQKGPFVKGFALLFKNKNLSLPDFYNKFQQVVKIEKDS